jgi:hypothetical protein
MTLLAMAVLLPVPSQDAGQRMPDLHSGEAIVEAAAKTYLPKEPAKGSERQSSMFQGEGRAMTELDRKLRGAVAKGDVAAVRALIREGANPFDWWHKPDSVEMAVGRSDEAVLRAIQESLPYSHKRPFLIVATRRAIDSDNSKAVRILSRFEGWDDAQVVNAPPLTYAARLGRLKCVAYLAATENNAVADYAGRIPHHYAAMSGEKILRKLARAKALIDAQDDSGWTPLHVAAMYRKDSVQYLLQIGANPNIRDKRGKLPKDLVSKAVGLDFYNEAVRKTARLCPASN